MSKLCGISENYVNINKKIKLIQIKTLLFKPTAVLSLVYFNKTCPKLKFCENKIYA